MGVAFRCNSYQNAPANNFVAGHFTITSRGQIMDKNTDTRSLRIVQQEKLLELQSQQKNLNELKAELDKINSKIKNHEKLSSEDTKFISELGWLSALSVTIASIAASI